ncbi:Membrane proteinase PrsW, cleaves anti-sigma factor RsiW, M82 family [Lachnospiraceae bacterium NK3A20]|nr:Membrane proteinase PrsW, cleaves anti-sigma factor RsiW, M82 family [Lachnospiraceae bacterium NK3A20]
MLLVLILGMVPALLLILYMYRLDKIEPEPVGLLGRLFLFGGLTTIAAGIIEEIGMLIAGALIWNPKSLIFLLVENFIVVGIAEEGMKHLALRRISWYRPEFNYRFDAVVYSTAVALGFAAFENVMYIFNFGLGVAPIRAITAIPMHCICGIFMGHYYGEAKLCEMRHEWSKMNYYQAMSLIIPILLHGFYDFAASSVEPLLSVIFLCYVIILDVIAFLSVRRYARQDVSV